jgi:FKBP-type peptidyl-prolyl cis-trans isomerase FklB
MKKLNLTFIIAVIALYACNSNGKKSQKLETQIDSVSYSLGTFNALQLQGQGLDDINSDAVSMGIEHVFNNDSVLISQEEAQNILENYFKALQEKQEAERLKKEDSLAAVAKAWIEERVVNEQIQTTSSGLQYEILINGEGDTNPTAENEVTVHYHGTLVDGTVFDSSIKRGEPVSFPVNGVIPGWVEALQLMQVGDKWKLTIPGNLAYGDNGIPQAGIPPNATLVFIVELLSIQ